MKRIIVACLGVLLTTTVVYADKPFQSRFSEEFSGPIECEGYDLILAFSVNTHVSRFFDKNGVIKSLHVQFKGDVEIYRDGFPDNVLYGRRADNQIADFPGGVFSGFVINGGFVKVNLPGYGPLYFDAGRVYFDSDWNITLTRGVHHDHLLQQTDAVCAYFQ